MRIILIFFLGFIFSLQGFCQTFDKKLICGKKWYYEKMQSDKMEVVKVSAAEKNDYFIYKCNGAFESNTHGKIEKGVWSFNNKDSNIKVVQPPVPPSKYEVKVVTKMIQADSTHLVLQGNANGGGIVTLYLVTR